MTTGDPHRCPRDDCSGTRGPELYRSFPILRCPKMPADYLVSPELAVAVCPLADRSFATPAGAVGPFDDPPTPAPTSAGHALRLARSPDGAAWINADSLIAWLDASFAIAAGARVDCSAAGLTDHADQEAGRANAFAETVAYLRWQIRPDPAEADGG